MKRAIPLLVAFLLLATAFAIPDLQAKAGSPKMMEFGTMIAVPRPYTGTTNAIRGVPGGGLPWVLSSAKGELSVSGKLEIMVNGLVLDPNDPGVPLALRGTNPIPAFRALVSCLSKDASGNPITVNVSTDPFPATTGPAVNGGGDAKIEAQVSLPEPCIAPIVFVTSPTGAWFAATGN
jgi:hypothetical protein